MHHLECTRKMKGKRESDFESNSFHRNIAANNQRSSMILLHAGDESLGRLAGMPAEEHAKLHLTRAARRSCLSSSAPSPKCWRQIVWARSSAKTASTKQGRKHRRSSTFGSPVGQERR